MAILPRRYARLSMDHDDARDRLEKERERLEQVEAELADVDRALRRLDDGTYGQCEVCGDDIGDDRLAAMPAARFCTLHHADAGTSA
jgi:RNA polymerase-binding transcription factor DksA